jgi:hypothetical protein
MLLLTCLWKRESLGNALTLATNNREFDRVPGLNVEDWTIAEA